MAARVQCWVFTLQLTPMYRLSDVSLQFFFPAPSLWLLGSPLNTLPAAVSMCHTLHLCRKLPDREKASEQPSVGSVPSAQHRGAIVRMCGVHGD